MIASPSTKVYPQESEYILTESSLLVNHGIVRHKTNPPPAPRPTSTRDVRNIAIDLLSVIQDNYEEHQLRFSNMREGRSGLNVSLFRRFVSELCPQVSQNHSTALFDAINVRLNSVIGWTEVMQYLIEAGIQGPVGRSIEALNKYVIHSATPYPRCSLINMQYSAAKEKLFLAYDMVTSTSKERCFRILDHSSSTGESQAIPNTNMSPKNVATTNNDNSKSNNGSNGSRVPIPAAANVFSYIAEFSSVVMGGLDMKLRYWLFDGNRLYSTSEFTHMDSVTSACHEHRSKSVWVGGSAGSLCRYNIQGEKLGLTLTTWPHASSVLKVCVLPRDGAVVSASAGSTLCIQDPERGSLITQYTGSKGSILDIGYWSDANSFITCGFDNRLAMWSVSSSPVKPVFLYDEIASHDVPIVKVRNIPGTPQILSLDYKGRLKLWDARTFRCVQSIFIPTAVPDAGWSDYHSFEVLGNEKSFLIGTRHAVVQFKYSNVPVGSSLCETENIVDMIYSAERNSLLVLTQTQFTVWEWDTSANAASYQNITTDENLCWCLVKPTRMYIGHSDGSITAHNLSNAALLWRCDVLTNREILEIIHVGSYMLLVLDSQNILYFLLEEGLERQVVSRVEIEQILVKCIDYDPESNIVALGELNTLTTHFYKPVIHRDVLQLIPLGSIRIRGLGPHGVKMTSKATFVDDSSPTTTSPTKQSLGIPQEHVTCCSLLRPHPMVAIGLSNGNVYLYTLRPHPHPWINVGTLLSDTRKVYAVTSLAFCDSVSILGIGTENGVVMTFRIQEIVDRVLQSAKECHPYPPKPFREMNAPYGRAFAYRGPIDHLHYVETKAVFLATSQESTGKMYRIDCKEVNSISIDNVTGHEPYDEQTPVNLLGRMIMQMEDEHANLKNDQKRESVASLLTDTLDTSLISSSGGEEETDSDQDSAYTLTLAEMRKYMSRKHTFKLQRTGTMRSPSPNITVDIKKKEMLNVTASTLFAQFLKHNDKDNAATLDHHNSIRPSKKSIMSSEEIFPTSAKAPETPTATMRLTNYVNLCRQQITDQLVSPRINPHPVYKVLPQQQQTPETSDSVCTQKETKVKRVPRMLRDKTDLMLPSSTGKALQRHTHQFEQYKRNTSASVHYHQEHVNYLRCGTYEEVSERTNTTGVSPVVPTRCLPALTTHVQARLTNTTTHTLGAVRSLSSSSGSRKKGNEFERNTPILNGSRCGTPSGVTRLVKQ
eukprot:PhF_6_TR25506/c2_g1_i2/m.35575